MFTVIPTKYNGNTSINRKNKVSCFFSCQLDIIHIEKRSYCKTILLCIGFKTPNHLKFIPENRKWNIILFSLKIIYLVIHTQFKSIVKRYFQRLYLYVLRRPNIEWIFDGETQLQRFPCGCIDREIEIRSVTPRGLKERRSKSKCNLYPFDLYNVKYKNIRKKGKIIIF